jgi:hypothetical protein
MDVKPKALWLQVSKQIVHAAHHPAEKSALHFSGMWKGGGAAVAPCLRGGDCTVAAGEQARAGAGQGSVHVKGPPPMQM